MLHLLKVFRFVAADVKIKHFSISCLFVLAPVGLGYVTLHASNTFNIQCVQSHQ